MIVLIADLHDNKRRESIARRFHEAGGTTYVVGQGVMSRAPEFEVRVALPKSFDLLVLHANEVDEKKLRKRIAGATLVVRYTGGVRPSPVEDGRHWIRARAIKSENDAPSQYEAKALVEWARRVLAGGAVEPLPELLVPPKEYRILPAFAVLCQGFLVAHTNEQGDPVLAKDHADYETVCQALSKMGWEDICKNDWKGNQEGWKAQLYERIKAARQEVTKSESWWAPVFEGLTEEGNLLEEAAGADIGAVLDLRNTVHRGRKIEAGPVARAYLELLRVPGLGEVQ